MSVLLFLQYFIISYFILYDHSYNKLHPPESGPVQVDTWQGEMEMMENVRLVHEMQSTMLREVRCVCIQMFM